MRRFLSSAAVLFALALLAAPVSAQGECDFLLFDLATDPPTEVETLTYQLGPEAPGIGFKLTGFTSGSDVTIDLMKDGETYQSDRFTVDSEGTLRQVQNPDETDIGEVTARATGGGCTAEAHYTVLAAGPVIPDTSTEGTSTEGTLRGVPPLGIALVLLLASVAAGSFATTVRRFAR